MRLFVALAPPSGVLDELEQACAPHRAGREDLRWTHREAWHVTLAFLGEVSELSESRLEPRLQRVAWRHRQFPLAFSGAGAFPSPGRANVLWSGIAGDRQALAALAASVTAAARRAGVKMPEPGRKFTPHLTLARCRAPANVCEIVACLDPYRGEQWTAREIFLIRSHLGGGPPRYQTLGSWPLRAPDSEGLKTG